MFGILRSDASWYKGTSDHQPVFSSDGIKSALFNSEEDAETRIEGLAKEDKDHTFEVIPVIDPSGEKRP